MALIRNLYLLFLFYAEVKTQQCTSRRLRVEEDKADTRLIGFTYITFYNEGPNSCFDKCIRRPECHSFNYNLDLRVCELNVEPTYSLPEDNLANITGYSYVTIGQYRGVCILNVL